MAFFTAANPLMDLGGFTDYSKYRVLKEINPHYLPLTQFFDKPTLGSIKEMMSNIKLNYPIILKPDKGERGFGVEKIDDEAHLLTYFAKNKDIGALILQEYVPYQLEIGVMYSRKPSEKQGKITSVVMKQFLSLTGDGFSDLQTLISTDLRAKFYADSLLSLYQKELQTVLAKNQIKELVAIGNHCRGTTFLDANHLINNQLHLIFDQISLPIKGYFFGRYDLRVSSLEDLYQGKNIKIMELNGAASEPAHIYDPSMSLIKAYRHLFAHWQRLYEISIENHQNGVPYAKAITVWKAIRNRGKLKNTILKQ
jgi:ATP-grasp domain